MRANIDASDIQAEKGKSSEPEGPNQLELFTHRIEIEHILGQNYLVKREMARRLHASGLSMETIGRILNLRVRMVKENDSE